MSLGYPKSDIEAMGGSAECNPISIYPTFRLSDFIESWQRKKMGLKNSEEKKGGKVKYVNPHQPFNHDYKQVFLRLTKKCSPLTFIYKDEKKKSFFHH